MNILLLLTSFFFICTLVGDAFFYLKLFEEKDYNARRVFVHLRETRRGKSILTGRVTIAKWIVILAYSTTIFINGIDNFYHIVVFTLYLLLFINLIKRFFSRELFVPKFSKITVIVFSGSMLLEFFLYLLPPIDVYLWMLVIDKLLLVFITLLLLLLSIFIDFGRDIVVNRAINKLVSLRSLLTIVVVGSYGRGTTKEYIARILSLKYNVLSTRSTFENSMSIAKTINKYMTPKKQIFIAEIDDYRKEDVAEICQLINPKIAVVCGINDQKLSMFGNVKNILESKKQAVNALSRDGIALFNGNSEYTKNIFNETTNKKFLYAAGKNYKADILATDIKEGKFSISFLVSLFGKTYRFSNVKLLGRQSIENLLPAIFIGVYAGIDFSRIRDAISELRPLPSTMNPGRTSSGAIVIDDTYNANINSVTRALSYMSLYEGKKILILEPLVELGKISKQAHFDIGAEAGKICTEIFLTNDNYFKSILDGVISCGVNIPVSVASPARISKFILQNCKKEDVIVFVGKEALAAIQAVKAEKLY